jgi:quinol-cytochrome oxidoreductase complex cytochrome b subunit
MRKITSLNQLEALNGQTYMYAIIIAIIALVVAFIIANLIQWGGKNSTDHIKRRVWFIIVGVTTPIAFFLFNAFYVNNFISTAPLQSQFSNTNIIATVILLGVYVLVGVITMLVLRRSKWGSILGKSKK